MSNRLTLLLFVTLAGIFTIGAGIALADNKIHAASILLVGSGLADLSSFTIGALFPMRWERKNKTANLTRRL